MKPEVLATRTLHKGWGKFLLVDMRLPNGAEVEREIEDHGSAISVLAYNPTRRTAILVSQFRAPVFLTRAQETVLEAIAGGIEESDPAACARREAMEEAGLRLRDLEHLTTAWTMPGISTERVDLYLAVYDDADRVGDGGGVVDEHEDITVVELALDELAAMADDKRLEDMKTLVLVQTLRLRRPDLFAQGGAGGASAAGPR
jgi:nudix-type nucleoside diphosphatase (YffH/AdpP family)